MQRPLLRHEERHPLADISMRAVPGQRFQQRSIGPVNGNVAGRHLHEVAARCAASARSISADNVAALTDFYHFPLRTVTIVPCAHVKHSGNRTLFHKEQISGGARKGQW